MKLRTQLLLAFLILAVLPLALLVLLSYRSTQQAFRQAVEAEALVLADEMAERLASSKRDLSRTVERLGMLAFQRSAVGAATGRTLSAAELQQLRQDLVAELGPVALPLVEKLELMVATPTGEDTLELVWPEEAPEAPEVPGEGLERARQALQLLTEEEDLVAEDAPEETRDWLQKALAALGSPREGAPRQALMARIPGEELVRAVLGRTPRDRGEVPFARDLNGRLFTQRPSDRRRLDAVPAEVMELGDADSQMRGAGGWVVATRRDPNTGITFGVARPIQESVEQMRAAAVRNLVLGLALLGLALLGILPLSAHLTRPLTALSHGAERIAAGDLQVRVPVSSENEIGQLARSFNRMAYELSENQRQLLEQERERQEQELQRQLLEVENARKSRELEEARRFQLALLPKRVPQPPGMSLAVYTRTATEVGGDYYDFVDAEGGGLIVAIGDATGHGARAGTLVAVIKSLFATRAPDSELPDFLHQGSRTIKGMGLERMAMALAVARLDGSRLEISSAGMPPALIYRGRSRQVEEVELPGMPLGGLLGFPYRSHATDLGPGDTLLLMTDGFPELLNPEEQLFGYQRVRAVFAGAAELEPEEIIAELAHAADGWRAGRALADDVTFVVVQASVA
jgi:serine phosphatase RsbU (regulator of sigma subunit)